MWRGWTIILRHRVNTTRHDCEGYLQAATIGSLRAGLYQGGCLLEFAMFFLVFVVAMKRR